MRDPSHDRPTPPESTPLNPLIESYWAGTMTPQQCDELSRRIVESPQDRDAYLRQTIVHVGLTEYVKNQEAIETVRELRDAGITPQRQATEPDESPQSSTDPSGANADHRRWKPAAVAATLSAIAAAIAFVAMMPGRPSRGPRSVSLRTDTPAHSPTTLPSDDQVPPSDPTPSWIVVKDDQSMRMIDEVIDRPRFALGPGRYQLLPQDGLPHSIKMQQGVLVAWLPPSIDDAVVNCDSLSLTGAGCLFGVSDENGKTRVAVFSGELAARHDDWLHPVMLTRNDGFERLPDGSVILSLIGAPQRFAELRRRLTIPNTRISNGSFHYPRLASVAPGTPRIPAGWTLVSHPIANADGMMSEGGLSTRRNHNEAALTDTTAGGHPPQFAYCEATTYLDGKSSWSSLHQSIGERSMESRPVIRVKVVNPERVEASGNVAWFSGEADEGPTTRLAEESFTITPAMNERWVELPLPARLNLPAESNPTSDGSQWYVVLSASPPANPGITRVYFDEVTLVDSQTHP